MKNKMVNGLRVFQSKDTNAGMRRVATLHRSATILIGSFIFLSPFPRITSIKEICFYAAVFFTVVLALDKKSDLSFKTPLSFPFALFVFWAFIGLFFSLDKGNSLHDFFSHLLKYIMLYFMLVNFFGSKKGVVYLSWIVVISASLFSIIGLVYYYGILNHPLTTRFALHLTEGRDFFGESPTNLIGVLTVFSIILSLQLFMTETQAILKVISAVCIIPLFTATILTQTRGSLIAMLVAVIFLFFKNKKMMLIILSVILLFVLLTPVKKRITAKTIFGNERIGLILISLEILKDYPITGTGLGLETFDKVIDQESYNKKIPKRFQLDQPFGAPHNMFFSIAMRLGVIGFALFIYIIIVAVKTCLQVLNRGKDDFLRAWALCALSAMGMFLVKGFFSPIFSHFTEVVFYTIFSMITILWNLNRHSTGTGASTLSFK